MTVRLAHPFWQVFSLSIAVTGAIIAVPCDAADPTLKAAYQRDPASEAKMETDMKPYVQKLRDTEIQFEMVPIRGGEFTLGSPDSEEGRNEDEGPQRKVKVAPFWMGKTEVTWDEYDVWRMSLDNQHRKLNGREKDKVDAFTDAVTRPTKEYVDMTFGMGHDGFPAIGMTQAAAKMYCEWLSAKTGHYYRLPTEAEWEYACRAGTTTRYSFGDDASKLGDYAWYYENSEDTYHQVGKKKPNPWGLHDMHGSVAEWVLDRYDPEFYSKLPEGKSAEFPVCVPDGNEYPRVVRGGSWQDDPEALRSAARVASTPDWKIQDPQLPRSIWYLTDGDMIGFRVVRPLTPPSEEEITKYRLKTDIPDDLQERYQKELKNRIID